MRRVEAKGSRRVDLGRIGENMHTVVAFPESREYLEMYPNATVRVLHKRPQDPDAYPVDPYFVNIENGIVEWEIQNSDLAQSGSGKCELLFVQDEVIAKSLIYMTEIMPALDGTANPPEPWEDWVRRLISASEHSPYMANGTWWVWDYANEVYVDTEVPATGPQGIQGIQGLTGTSITGTVLNNDYTLTVYFSNGTSYTTPVIRGATGNGISSVVLNANDTLTITFTDGNTYISPSIRGPKGEQGEPFTVKKTFESIEEMNAYDGTDLNEGNFIMISSNTEDPDNAKLYIKTANGYTFITDLSGTQGMKGEPGRGISSITHNADNTLTITYTDGTSYTTGSIKGAIGLTPILRVGTVQDLSAGSVPTVTIGGTPEYPVINFGIPHGASGNESIDDNAGVGDYDLVWSADKLERTINDKADVDFAESLESDINTNKDRLTDLETAVIGHVASGEVVDGVAHFYNDAGEELFEITGIGGGGGGGGGSQDVTSVITFTNNNGWASTTTPIGADLILSFTWSSLEDDVPTGDGTATVVVNNVMRESRNIAQGNFTINVKDYLVVGTNKVTVTVTDIYGKSRPKTFTISAVELSLSSTFDPSVIQHTALSFPYTPYGAFSKTIHFELDGTELETVTSSSSGRQMTQVIAQQTHGAHRLRVWFVATINGQSVTSNVLSYEIVWVIGDNTTPIIASSFSDTTADQYSTLTIPFMVYTPNSLVSNVTVMLDETTLMTLPNVGREMQSIQVRLDETGSHTISIISGSTTKQLPITVSMAEMSVEAETEDLKLFLTSRGRSNLEANPGTWTFTDSDQNTISATMTGFNYVSNGWVQDNDGITALRLNAGATVTIPFKPFKDDFRSTGYTIELEFAVRDVQNYASDIIKCYSGDRGLVITPQTASISSEQSNMSVQYKDDDHIRVSFVYEKRAQNRLLMTYINGIPSRVVQYPNNDDFTQVTPVNITLDGTYATVDVYNIRIYGNNLTGEQILGNWIADTQDGETMLMRYSRNNVYDAYGTITIDKLPSNLPYMIIECEELPQYKGDKKTCSGQFVNPLNPNKSFTFTGCQINVQGTSSAVYARKNYDMQFKNGFEMSNGQHENNFRMISTVKPFNRFVMKADVASSEGANNVELVKLYNDIAPYKRPEMVADSEVRYGIYGFPIVIFWNNTTNNTTTFLGKYNFNFPKRAPAPYGYSGDMESWEFQNNTSNLMLFKTDYFDETMKEDPTTGDVKETWRYDYEARFPNDTWTDYSKLQELESFIYSTYRDEATEDPLSSSVTYEGTTYTSDTAAYRLAKFRAEFGNYAEIDSFVFYYVFTEFFLLADSRAKNLFIGFSGSNTDPTKVTVIDRKAVCEPYDMDTALGINNEGSLTFTYSLEDTDHTSNGRDVFTGQSSVLWNNLRDAFPNEIRQMYQRLRSNSLMTYANIEGRFEDHQSYWPEAIWIEDSRFKYINPLTSPDPGKEPTDAYLEMMLGSKTEQRRWWLSNRFRYMDSKWSSGDALAEVIQFRAYAASSLTITPYSDLYVTVKYGSYTGQQKTPQGTPVTIQVPIDNLSDTETYIYSASQIANVGDLSPFKIGWADFSHASRIQEIKIGDSDPEYENLPFERLTLGNNRLLRKIDCRNCPNLGTGEMKSVNMSGCTSIQEAYFDNTSITAVDLPNGSPIRKLHLPGTITNLTLRNQLQLTEFVLPDYSNITTLFLENPASCIDTASIVEDMPEGGRVRLYNFHWELEDLDDVGAMFEKLDTMRGIDQNGNNTDTAQVYGTINVQYADANIIEQIQAAHPNVTITYEHITSNVYYYSWDGETLLDTEQYVDGVGSLYDGEPARTSTAQYHYTFVGWALEADAQEADEDALSNVTMNRTVYAAYSRQLRYYTATFVKANVDGGGILYTQANIPYGTTPTYGGSTPTSSNTQSVFVFNGWTPALGPIEGNTTYTATFDDIGIPVTFMNGNTVLATIKVASGNNVTYSGTTPTKTQDVYYTYTFAGWNTDSTASAADSNALKNITEAKTVYAIFTATAVLYTITFTKASEDGGGTLQIIQRTYGTTPSYTGTEPTSTREGFEFVGWTPDIAPVTGNQVYVAKFSNETSKARALIKRSIAIAEDNEVTSIGYGAFYSCYSLTTASFPAVTSIGDAAFRDCSSLTTVSFPAATSIGNSAFYSCTSLTTASFPEATSIGNSAFTCCYVLTTASFPAATSIGNYAFAYCLSLTTASFPAATSIGSNAFYSCRSLTTVSFPVATSIGSNAFANCPALTTASFPAATNIGSNAFASCHALTTASFPAVTSIDNYAFAYCYSLTTVSFPAVTYIGEGAFGYCTDLTTVVLGNELSIALARTGIFSGASSAIIYVPDALVSGYKTATNWSQYASRIKGISELPVGGE